VVREDRWIPEGRKGRKGGRPRLLLQLGGSEVSLSLRSGEEEEGRWRIFFFLLYGYEGGEPGLFCYSFLVVGSYDGGGKKGGGKRGLCQFTRSCPRERAVNAIVFVGTGKEGAIQIPLFPLLSMKNRERNAKYINPRKKGQHIVYPFLIRRREKVKSHPKNSFKKYILKAPTRKISISSNNKKGKGEGKGGGKGGEEEKKIRRVVVNVRQNVSCGGKGRQLLPST